ncbi:MAG: amidase family protein, partial [Methanocorpusculum sp.]|nr:amidase family protein [Methanocorpusculum sp.]
SMKYALPAYYVTCTCEASSNLGRFDGVRFGPEPEMNLPWHDAYTKVREAGFGGEVRRRILLGTFALSAGYYGKYYVKAQHAKQLIAKDFAAALQTCDMLAGPTMPNIAPKIGELTADPLQMYLADILTVPVNIAGIPAISVPCGTAHGMPVGLQLMGRMFGEETILNAALAFEEAV